MSRAFANRYVRIALMAIGLLGLLIVLTAPNSRLVNGSSFSRAPNGYLGWYSVMVEQGLPLQRWQRSPSELVDQNTVAEPSQTLIQVWPQLINPERIWQQAWVKDWLHQGNRLIILGAYRPVTDAAFSTQSESPQGSVTIQTRRRQIDLESNRSLLLGDDAGAIVWQETRADGTIVFATTPYLAANAYQAIPGNYDFLTALASETGGHIWIDEYLHGYRETGALVEEVAGNWLSYLARTPILVVTLQIAVLTGILILAQNQRPGTRSILKVRQVDNSQAYIQALAGVLHKAKGARFVVAMIAKAERLHLQKALGFGENLLVDDAVLGQAWVQMTGHPERELAPLLTPPTLSTPEQDRSLRTWLTQLQQIRCRLSIIGRHQR